jgi:polyisoprenyl-phosphate glycosyltransferase
VKKKLISIVIPMFNEEDNIIPLYDELCSELIFLTYFSEYEIIAVNDGSSDTTLAKLKQLAHKDVRVKIVSFTRNFGHENATYAGIYHSAGEAVILIDADRQDPPSLIKEFEKEYLNGYNIVFGQRTKRTNESWLRKATAKAFYPIFKALTKVDIPQNVGDFCLLSRRAVDIMLAMPEKAIFVRGLIYWSGLSKKAVYFFRRGRGAGASKYNYSKLTIFALENIVSFSTVPIYFILFASMFVIISCIVGTLVAFLMYLFGFVIMTGWTSLIMCMLFLFSCTLFFMGILGLYIGTIFQETKQRPLFLVDEKINFDASMDKQRFESAIASNSNTLNTMKQNKLW